MPSLLARSPDYVSRTDRAQQFNEPSMHKDLLGSIPPLAEQKAIAAVLGALDDKIELNRRMNATLEAMARALFQSWFVDFDPVRAKLDGRQPAGLDPATAALFPATFQDSPFGPIPHGWRACTLGDIATNVSITFDFKRITEAVFINTGDVLEGDFLHSNRSLMPVCLAKRRSQFGLTTSSSAKSAQQTNATHTSILTPATTSSRPSS